MILVRLTRLIRDKSVWFKRFHAPMRCDARAFYVQCACLSCTLFVFYLCICLCVCVYVSERMQMYIWIKRRKNRIGRIERAHQSLPISACGLPWHLIPLLGIILAAYLHRLQVLRNHGCTDMSAGTALDFWLLTYVSNYCRDVVKMLTEVPAQSKMLSVSCSREETWLNRESSL